jgi:cyclopropane fatty-acyl-phospholipid synthase-like methyltransferase
MNPKITTADIRSYYSSTLQDYKDVWLNGENLSMHFGYEDDRSSGHAASLLKANQVLADLARISEGDRVLDAGCGLGGGSLWLANERRARVTGIALGAEQILLARREARRRSLTARTQFIVADFTMLPFAKASFDVVWAHESLCHAQDKPGFFREASRVLVPGGRVVVADFMLRRRQHSRNERRMLEQWFDGWKLAGLWTAAQHAGAAKSAGLDQVCIQDFTPYTISSHRRLYHRARRMLPVEMTLQMAGMRGPLQHGNFVAALRQYQTLRRDCWFYGTIVAQKQ